MGSGGGLGRRAGWLLVALQGVLFVAIAAWPGDWGPSVPVSRPAAVVFAMVGSAAVLASAASLGGALTPLPHPNGGGLRASGLYRWVRHPMYAGVLVASVGVAWWRGSLVVWFVVVALGVFFEFKTRAEESLLAITYEGYAEYRRVTGKFVPRLWGPRHPG